MRGLNFVYIYALVEVEEGVPRYVGSTSDPKRRFRQHFESSVLKRETKIANWVKECVDTNKTIIMVLLDSIHRDEAAAREVYWIQHFLKLGVILMNTKEK